MNGAQNARSASLLSSDELSSNKLKAVHTHHRHSAGDLEDVAYLDWDKLQLPQRSDATSSTESIRSSNDSNKRSRANSGNDIQQRDTTALTAAEEPLFEQHRKENKSGHPGGSTDEAQQINVSELYDGIFVNMGFAIPRDQDQQRKLDADKRRQVKQNAELPLALRKASLEASLRLNSGVAGRTRYTIDKHFTSVVDNLKEESNGVKKINKTASMPEIKEAVSGDSVGDCLQLPAVQAIPAVPSNKVSISLYSNPLRYISQPSRMTRQDMVDAQMENEVEAFAFNQLASVGWW